MGAALFALAHSSYSKLNQREDSLSDLLHNLLRDTPQKANS
jgi:hypothetical protein